MKDTLFDTKDKVENAIATIKDGKGSQFWQLMAQVLARNIDALTDLILEKKNFGGETATEKELDQFRERLRVYKRVKDQPEHLLNLFASPDSDVPSADPFQTVDQLRAEREKRSQDAQNPEGA